jgi:hypothetical protein
MESASKGVEIGSKFFEDLLETLADKHLELNIRLQGANIRLPSAGVSVEVNGTVTLMVHMRDLTEDEKKASAAKNVMLMSKDRGSES